ncbi:MAG: hypothetical protein Q4D90_00250 [bacterium]|nr:hypothetical protein [bacterium]
MHITEEQLYNLAELSRNMKPLNVEEEKQLEHMKICRECFNKYCVLVAILDATSLSYIQMSKEIPIKVKKALAVLKVSYEYIQNRMSLICEQVPQDTAVFSFEQTLSGAVRGGNIKKSTLHMVDLDDEGTYFIFDAERHKLMIQFRIQTESADYKVSVKFATQPTIEIPLESKGNYMKGVLEDIPEEEFEIYIEEN